MRAGGCFLCVLCLGATCVIAQVADESAQTEPYNKHYDRHLGHDHMYPDRGAIFRDVPRGATVVNYAGLSFRFYNGVWFEPRGPAFIVVMPPIGMIVPSVPSFATPFESGGRSYLYANDVYYVSRPDLGGYEVVNDPADVAPTGSAKATSASTNGTPIGYSAASAVPTISSASLAAGLATSTTASASAAAAPVSAGASAHTSGPVPASHTLIATSALAPTSAGSAAHLAAAASPSGSALPAVSGTTRVAPAPGGGLAATPIPSVAPSAASPSSTAPLATGGAPAPLVGPPARTPSVQSASSAGSGAPRVTSLPPQGIRVSAYPRYGQSLDEQARDQYDCYAFGVSQSGYDPLHSGNAMWSTTQQAEFARARAACYESRGYSLR